MKTTIGCLLLAGFLSWGLAPSAMAPSAQAHEPAPNPAPPVDITATVTSEITSTINGEIYKIDVALPYTYLEEDKHYPVIYLTDGNGYFSFVVGNLRMLQLSGEMPGVIVVGIGYANPTVEGVMAKRARDLTPSIVEGSRMPLPDGMKTGGAGEFLQFIEGQVKPFVNQFYRTDTSDETLVGYSFGGLFGTYVLFNHGDAFDKYIIGSPSLVWDNHLCFQYEEDYAKSNKDLAKRVFMSAGDLERYPDNPAYDMVLNMERMAAQLETRNYPGLSLQSHVFEGETHQSGIGTAINRGLRWVFKDQLVAPSWMQDDED